MAKQINYSKRDFNSLKSEQINFIKQYYPGLVQNFNDASVLSVFLDLNAAIADNLHFHIDRALQETVLDYAQERQSLFNIAKTYGLKLPSRSASIAVCQFSVQVPVRGDAENPEYLPVINAGSQFNAGPESFELLFDVDFSSNFNSAGRIDRTKIPVFANGNLSAYRITKTGLVVAGATRVYTQKITNTRPFYQITLPENNVLSIDSVIHKNGVSFQSVPTNSEFLTSINKWYEVPALVEDSAFVETSDVLTNGVFSGDYIKTDRRFIKEFSPSGNCTLTFGSMTNQGLDILDDFIDGGSFDLRSFINNNSLGFAPFNNTTLYVKYKIGGGINTNVNIGAINSIGLLSLTLNGPDPQINAIVESSLAVSNVTPAIGGSDTPSIEELRQYIGYNFAAQNRAVTLQDYRTLLLGMPTKFGVPSKVNVTQIQNKINVSVLTLDSDGGLSNLVSSTVLENIANYLSRYRMINDYVVVRPAEIINVSFQINVSVSPGFQISATSAIITAINEDFSRNNMDMGKNYSIGAMTKKINQIDGIISVDSVNVFNKIGGVYSSDALDDLFILDPETNQIDILGGILRVNANQILQIKVPEQDIVVIPTVKVIN
jgi:hypothetical protein